MLEKGRADCCSFAQVIQTDLSARVEDLALQKMEHVRYFILALKSDVKSLKSHLVQKILLHSQFFQTLKSRSAAQEPFTPLLLFTLSSLLK